MTVLVRSKVCCTAPHSLTSVGQTVIGVVVDCVTGDSLLRMCVCVCAHTCCTMIPFLGLSFVSL